MTVIMEKNSVRFGQATERFARLLKRLQDRVQEETMSDSYREDLVLILKFLADLLDPAHRLFCFGIDLGIESWRVGIYPAFQSCVWIGSNDVRWFGADVKTEA